MFKADPVTYAIHHICSHISFYIYVKPSLPGDIFRALVSQLAMSPDGQPAALPELCGGLPELPSVHEYVARLYEGGGSLPGQLVDRGYDRVCPLLGYIYPELLKLRPYVTGVQRHLFTVYGGMPDPSELIAYEAGHV